MRNDDWCEDCDNWLSQCKCVNDAQCLPCADGLCDKCAGKCDCNHL